MCPLKSNRAYYGIEPFYGIVSYYGIKLFCMYFFSGPADILFDHVMSATGFHFFFNVDAFQVSKDSQCEVFQC